jgi:hypothetical protein
MLSNGIERGFPAERLKRVKEPKVHKDDGGFFIFTLNENAKVYFEDFYQFLEKVEKKCLKEKRELEKKIIECDSERTETLSYYRARKIIIDVVLKNVYSFYGDSGNFGVIMSPWCFGTVILEKVENYKEMLSCGEIQDFNIPEYPYFVLKYLDEIYKKTLLEVFDFPDKAFKVRWQYTEMFKRYSKLLPEIIGGLETILLLIKSSS